MPPASSTPRPGDDDDMYTRQWSHCKLVRAPTKGRHVLCNQAVVEAGTTLLEDMPYAAVVADIYRGVACAHCLRICTTCIYQCGGCELTRYCSEACLRLDASMCHAGKECTALHRLQRLGVEGDSKAIRLALRILVHRYLSDNKHFHPHSISIICYSSIY